MTVHVNKVTKNVGEEVQLQSLVETFTGKVKRWWGTHQSHLQTWTTTSTHFIKSFRGKNITEEAKIKKFILGSNPQEHIINCESKWKGLGYKDEIVWPHLFSSTLDDLPNKRYKIEEARGDTFTWKTLKENFIKDFSFNPHEDQLKEATKHIKEFVQDPYTMQVDQKSSTSYNQVVIDQNCQIASRLKLEND